MATINDFKAASDAALAEREAQITAAMQAAQGAMGVPQQAAKAAPAVRGGGIQVPQLDLSKFLPNQQRMNTTDLSSLLRRLGGQGAGQVNMGINPMTGAPIGVGDYSKSIMQRLFGGTDAPNFWDKAAYVLGGTGWQPMQQPGEYVNVHFPDEGVEYPGLNYGNMDINVGADLIPSNLWASDLGLNDPLF